MRPAWKIPASSRKRAAPTPLAFSVGGNTIIGTTFYTAGPAPDPDYIRFTIPSGMTLVDINLLAFSPDDIAFTALNSGTKSFVPDLSTIGNFLAGIHIEPSLIGSDLLLRFQNNSVTTNSLPTAELGPGNYCFLIQQANITTTAYSIEFVLESPVPSLDTSWGHIKALFN